MHAHHFSLLTLCVHFVHGDLLYRREWNRVNAQRSRARRTFLVESLQGRIDTLQSERGQLLALLERAGISQPSWDELASSQATGLQRGGAPTAAVAAAGEAEGPQLLVSEPSPSSASAASAPCSSLQPTLPIIGDDDDEVDDVPLLPSQMTLPSALSAAAASTAPAAASTENSAATSSASLLMPQPALASDVLLRAPSFSLASPASNPRSSSTGGTNNGAGPPLIMTMIDTELAELLAPAGVYVHAHSLSINPPAVGGASDFFRSPLASAGGAASSAACSPSPTSSAAGMELPPLPPLQSQAGAHSPSPAPAAAAAASRPAGASPESTLLFVSTKGQGGKEKGGAGGVAAAASAAAFTSGGGGKKAGTSSSTSSSLDPGDSAMVQLIATCRQHFLITDPTQHDNPIVFASQGFFDLTGYTPAETIGRNCRFLQGPDTDPRAVAHIRRGLAAQEDEHMVIKNYTKGGQPFWNELFMAPLKDVTGDVVRFIGVQCQIPEEFALPKLAEQEGALLK